MRVVIADDEVLLREGLDRLLTEAGLRGRRQGGERRRAAAQGRAHAAGRRDRRHQDAADAHRRGARRRRSEIRESHPDIGVLVLSHYLESRYAMRLLEQHPGGVGYLLKERVSDIAVLADALRADRTRRVRGRPDDRLAARQARRATGGRSTS